MKTRVMKHMQQDGWAYTVEESSGDDRWHEIVNANFSSEQNAIEFAKGYLCGWVLVAEFSDD